MSASSSTSKTEMGRFSETVETCRITVRCHRALRGHIVTGEDTHISRVRGVHKGFRGGESELLRCQFLFVCFPNNNVSSNDIRMTVYARRPRRRWQCCALVLSSNLGRLKTFSPSGQMTSSTSVRPRPLPTISVTSHHSSIVSSDATESKCGEGRQDETQG